VIRRGPPERHWLRDATEPLPAPQEALREPMRAFPSWFLKITCDRCGKDSMLNEAHASDRQHDIPVGVFIARMRHDECGGRMGRVELLTGLMVSRPRSVRRIVLRAG
jgi:hypothetical protein